MFIVEKFDSWIFSLHISQCRYIPTDTIMAVSVGSNRQLNALFAEKEFLYEGEEEEEEVLKKKKKKKCRLRRVLRERKGEKKKKGELPLFGVYLESNGGVDSVA